jgi:hypothetical protein
MLLDQLFYSVDKLLPRKLAAWPYQEALNSIQSEAMGARGIRAWARNSYRKGNFTFGISDLDLTVLIFPEASARDVSRFRSFLESQKVLYPFLGEVNFYFHEKLPHFESALNFYEKSRDPELGNYLENFKTHSEIEKAAFLLRMIYSDRVRLIQRPAVRQKKWQEHFRMLELPSHQRIQFPDVLRVLSELLKIDTQVVNEALSPLDHRLTEETVFEAGMPRYWRFLYPNKHLWFHFGPEEDIEKVRGTSLGQVCLKQIEWEVWGIMSQALVLTKHREGVERHLRRLVQVSTQLTSESQLGSQVDELLTLL